MADFRQLALEFVLEDDDSKLTILARRAATALQDAAPASNPVAKWVEAVQPWMPGSQEDSDSQDTSDWPSRAKALEFLSRTLDFVSPDLMKPSQVKLLVAFFSAMFDVDHKAGIMASATALSRIVAMKSFQPVNGHDIIQKVCALRDDFARQIAKTRLAVYNLLRSLITMPAVAKELRRRDGATAGFMINLVDLCCSERDPDCLFVWFDILARFLQQYDDLSPSALEEVFNAFKAYYPITLLRTAQSELSPEELKQQLRRCFTSTHRLAPHAFPFLIGKLDQGDGVTVNVKLDILKTIKACLEDYAHVEQSIVPYVDRLWTCLKYEVRNGEVEDTMWGTLEVLKTLATRLGEDDLRDYTLNVTRDCVNDLANPTYCAPSGRLLISVLSASPSAFTLMVAPAVTHIKENLRHPKSPAHSQDLLKLLFVILETRVLLVDNPMSEQDQGHFAAVDGIFKTLFNDVYKAPLELACQSDATDEDISTSTEAVQGAGALVSQRIVSLDGSSRAGLLLPEATCSQICQSLFSITLQSFTSESQESRRHELINETAKALSRAIRVYPQGFRPIVDQAVQVVQARPSTEAVQKLGPLLGFIGCSELPQDLASGMHNFVYLFCSWTRELVASINAGVDSEVWCALVAGMQSIARYLNDALAKHATLEDQAAVFEDPWKWTSGRYPMLGVLDGPGDAPGEPLQELSASQARSDFLLISLFVVRHLYRRATSKVDAGTPALRLSDDFAAFDEASRHRYLHLLSDLASFVVRELSEAQQLSLRIDEHVLNLFQDEAIAIPGQGVSGFARLADEPAWSWLIRGEVNVLSLGLLESLRVAGAKRLFDNGAAHDLLMSGIASEPTDDSWTRPVARSMLTTLANKCKMESVEGFTTVLRQRLADSLNGDTGSRGPEQTSAVCAVVAGLLRRHGGAQTQGLLGTLREAAAGSESVARKLEMLVAPQRVLSKERFAVVKPLWMQRVYVEMVRPMMAEARTSSNSGVGVVLMVRHLPLPVYEDDAGEVVRVAIAMARASREVPATLEVVRTILGGKPEAAQEHVKSLVEICVECFAGRQMTPGGVKGGGAGVECSKVALEIVAALPGLLEARYLLALAARVRREMALACGHPVRDVRRIARQGRAAWGELK